MKKTLILLCSIACITFLNAQISVSPIELVKLNPGSFSGEDLSKLKSSKTVFIYRPGDNVEELKAALKPIWKITSLRFVPYSEFDDVNFDNTSVFSIRGVNKTRYSSTSSMSYDNTYIYLSLWMKGYNRKGKPEDKIFCRVELHPTFVDYSNVTITRKDDALNYLYNEGQLKNWGTGFLKNSLQVVNDYLSEGETRWLYQNEISNELKNLKSQPLYIVDYAMVKFNKFTGDESKRLEEEKIFKSYPYKYKLTSEKELSQKIISAEKPFYYMVYIKSSTDKYVTIYNSKTGAVVYSKYSPASYNLKDGDFKDLAKAIKKQ